MSVEVISSSFCIIVLSFRHHIKSWGNLLVNSVCMLPSLLVRYFSKCSTVRLMAFPTSILTFSSDISPLVVHPCFMSENSTIVRRLPNTASPMPPGFTLLWSWAEGRKSCLLLSCNYGFSRFRVWLEERYLVLEMDITWISARMSFSFSLITCITGECDGDIDTPADIRGCDDIRTTMYDPQHVPIAPKVVHPWSIAYGSTTSSQSFFCEIWWDTCIKKIVTL